MSDEKDRIRFVEGRHGKIAAIEFAKQTLEIYLRDTILTSKYRESIEYIMNYLHDEAEIDVKIPGYEHRR